MIEQEMVRISHSDRLPPEAQILAFQVRVPERGPLDIRSCAAQLEVAIAVVPKLEGLGLAVGTETILLERGMSRPESRIVFAHEVGHILVRRGILFALGDEETMADQFGDEMALPSELTRRHSDLGISGVADLFDVPLSRAAAQFARNGLIPSLSRLASGDVICARCGDRRSLGCRCLYYRVNRHKVVGLPLAS